VTVLGEATLTILPPPLGNHVLSSALADNEKGFQVKIEHLLGL
jgi:hypothetical protein